MRPTASRSAWLVALVAAAEIVVLGELVEVARDPRRRRRARGAVAAGDLWPFGRNGWSCLVE
jgi:hypothetical protein